MGDKQAACPANEVKTRSRICSATRRQWPTDLTELAKDLGIDLAVKLPAWFATKVLIRIIESRLKPGPGLYTWEDATRQPGPAGTPMPVSLEGFAPSTSRFSSSSTAPRPPHAAASARS